MVWPLSLMYNMFFNMSLFIHQSIYSLTYFNSKNIRKYIYSLSIFLPGSFMTTVYEDTLIHRHLLFLHSLLLISQWRSLVTVNLLVIEKDTVLTTSTHIMEVRETAAVTTTNSSSKEIATIISLERTNKL